MPFSSVPTLLGPFAVALGTMTGAPPVTPIVGGDPVEAGAWGSVVRVEDRCTGTLVHPEVVVYAGHCGQDVTFITVGPGSPGAQARAVLTERCAVHPEAGATYGHDVAVCVLAEAVDVPPIPLAHGCVAESTAPGRPALLVGFGRTSPTGDAGIEHAVWSEVVDREGLEWVIGDATAGTCTGDSGGPALVRHEGMGASGWWLLGVLSAGEAGTCGLGYYSDVASHVAWLESVTQRDLATCFDADERWVPTRACTDSAIDASGVTITGATWSSACGPAFAGGEDVVPPVIDVVEWSALEVVVEADDDEGIARVELELLDAEGRALARMADEIAPYSFALPPEVSAVWVRARDLAGNATEAWAEREDGESVRCAMGGGRSWGGVLSWIVLLLAARSGRRR